MLRHAQVIFLSHIGAVPFKLAQLITTGWWLNYPQNIFVKWGSFEVKCLKLPLTELLVNIPNVLEIAPHHVDHLWHGTSPSLRGAWRNWSTCVATTHSWRVMGDELCLLAHLSFIRSLFVCIHHECPKDEHVPFIKAFSHSGSGVVSHRVVFFMGGFSAPWPVRRPLGIIPEGFWQWEVGNVVFSTWQFHCKLERTSFSLGIIFEDFRLGNVWELDHRKYTWSLGASTLPIFPGRAADLCQDINSMDVFRPANLFPFAQIGRNWCFEVHALGFSFSVPLAIPQSRFLSLTSPIHRPLQVESIS